MADRKRIPAEWENYEAVMIAWPHFATDWADMLDEVTSCYVNLVRAIIDSGLRVLVVTPEVGLVREILEEFPQDKLIIFQAPTNDTWTRDYGPITLETPDGVSALDFQFNGWGLKFAANLDNMVTLRMVEASLLTRRYVPCLDFVFEGGSMEVDGCSQLLPACCRLTATEWWTKRLYAVISRKRWASHGCIFLNTGILPATIPTAT